MPVENRIAAAELFWDDEQSTDQQLEAVAALATHMKFRTKSVLEPRAGAPGQVSRDAAQRVGLDRRARAGELSPGAGSGR